MDLKEEDILGNDIGRHWYYRSKAAALGRFSAGVVDPATLVLPASPRAFAAVLPCAAHELLQLAPPHLTLTTAAEPSAGECA